MLKEALRRLLWLVPTLFVVTVPVFWALCRATPPPLEAGTRALPLFFNPNPLDVRQRAIAALSRAADGEEDGRAALAALGGAALPHVLPRLDSLAPDARGRAALALSSVAERMGIGQSSDFATKESAVLFWSRFWEEHSIDFRPLVVRRAVKRFAERPSALRRTEVRELDTFALEELIDELRPVTTPADVVRVRNLGEAAAHATGTAGQLPEGASVDDARRAVRHWEEFWLSHRGEFASFEGARRLAAMVLETRYGRWAEHVIRFGLGSSNEGASIAGAVRDRAPLTLSLVLAGFWGGHSLSLLVALTMVPRRRLWDLATHAFALFVVGAASIALAGFTLPPGAGRPGAFVAMGVATLALSLRRARAVHDRIGRMPFWQHARAFGVPLHRSALASLRLSIPPAMAFAAADLPMVLTTALVVERAYGLHGMGEIVVLAAKSGDMTWLMALALLGTGLLGIAQIAADVLLPVIDPRAVLPIARAHGAER